MSSELERLSEIVKANILAIHAYQTLLVAKRGKGDKTCFAMGKLDEAKIKALVAHQVSLLAEDPKAVKAWAKGKPSAFDPEKDLQPLLNAPIHADDPRLPVNVLSSYFQAKAKTDAARAGAMASLYQLMFEIERDADVLLQLFAFYAGLGLPACYADLDLPYDDTTFAAMGKELAGKFCATPYDSGAEVFVIMGQKITNWGMRYTGRRDRYVLADELLSEPDVQAMLPAIKAMPAQRIATIGHSFTMDVNWSSPSAFVPIVFSILAKVNPAIQTRQWEGGGLTPSHAFKAFYNEALAWKPDKVFFVMCICTEQDAQNFTKMLRGFAAQGAKVHWFDDLRQSWLEPSAIKRDIEEIPNLKDFISKQAQTNGLTVIEVAKLLHESPRRDKFLSLDGIHMTEPFHRLMAKQFLGFLCGARGAKL